MITEVHRRDPKPLPGLAQPGVLDPGIGVRFRRAIHAPIRGDTRHLVTGLLHRLAQPGLIGTIRFRRDRDAMVGNTGLNGGYARDTFQGCTEDSGAVVRPHARNDQLYRINTTPSGLRRHFIAGAFHCPAYGAEFQLIRPVFHFHTVIGDIGLYR